MSEHAPQLGMRSDDSSRRRFLGQTAALAGAIGLAGCLSLDSGDGTGGASSTRTTADDESLTSATASDASTSADTETASPTEANTPTQTPPRDALIEAPHGTTIQATVYGSGDCGVVLVPQINEDRESWEPQAEMVASMGHLALAVDEDPENRAASVRGAVQYLRTGEGVSTVVLVGASTGGEAVVTANAKADDAVDGTVTLSAAGGAEHAAELEGRTLFVASNGDEKRFVQTARELHAGAPEPTELLTYDGSAHGQGLFDSEHGEDLRSRLRRFIAEACEAEPE